MKRNSKITEVGYKLYKACARCFYLSYKHGIDRPTVSTKKQIQEVEASEEIIKEVKKTLSKGIPLPSPKCPYCLYRHLVKETGVENEISA